MLNVHNLTVSFMGTELFSGITFKLNKGDRIGLIGKNGAGKSTLLKVLSKDIESSGGTMAFDKDVQIGFLRQDIDFVEGRTILEEAYQAFEEIKELEVQLDEINEQLATRTDYESEAYSQLIIDLTEKTERYELVGGYGYQRIASVVRWLCVCRRSVDRRGSYYGHKACHLSARSRCGGNNAHRQADRKYLYR